MRQNAHEYVIPGWPGRARPGIQMLSCETRYWKEQDNFGIQGSRWQRAPE